MSEYQRYEFMTCDRPLTRAQLDAVNDLSSHIHASSTHALIEYHWGDFKHDPLKVLHTYFDGFLYWANWGSPQLALRFPHGALPANLIEGYDFEDVVTFTKHADYDILHFQISEMEPPDEMLDCELSSFLAIRDELLEGDLRSLYIGWLSSQSMLWDESEEGEEDDEDDEEDGEEDDEDNELRGVPPVPYAFGALTKAQKDLAELLFVPEELLTAASRHSQTGKPLPGDNFAAWVELLPQERRNDYLLRLARNEPGLSRLLAQELRALGQGQTKVTPTLGERISYTTLYAESEAIRVKQEYEQRAQERLVRQNHLQDIHKHKDTHWRQAEIAAARGTGTGYEEAVKVLVELRDAADYCKETQQFQERLRTWVQPHLRRPALLKRLQADNLTWTQE